jgi:uncharacterized protein YkwD
MKNILVRPTLAAITALVLFILGSAAPASAEEPCALLVVCPSEPPVNTQPEQPPAEQQPQPAPAQPSQRSAAEITADLLTLMNRERAARGLPLFSRRDDVDGVAAGWSDHLADAGELSHNDAYFTPESRRRLGGRALGENVARDAEAAPAHEHLMASPHHRDNILDARFTVVGLGATYRHGSWWITQDFLQPASPAPSREIARSAGGPTRSTPTRTATAAPTTTAAPVAPPVAAEPVQAEHWLVTAPGFDTPDTTADAPEPGSSPVRRPIPEKAAGLAIGGLCGVSGILLRRRRALSLAIS